MANNLNGYMTTSANKATNGYMSANSSKPADFGNTSNGGQGYVYKSTEGEDPTRALGIQGDISGAGGFGVKNAQTVVRSGGLGSEGPVFGK